MFFKLMNTVNDKWNNGKEKHSWKPCAAVNAAARGFFHGKM